MKKLIFGLSLLTSLSTYAFQCDLSDGFDIEPKKIMDFEVKEDGSHYAEIGIHNFKVKDTGAEVEVSAEYHFEVTRTKFKKDANNKVDIDFATYAHNSTSRALYRIRCN